MANVAVIGAQWGDEGKGKVVDWLASRADIVVRFQGGHNAGHTLVVGNETYKLSLLPSAAWCAASSASSATAWWSTPRRCSPRSRRVRAPGPRPSTPDTLRIAENAPLILPLHRALDRAREAARGERKIGTTGRGIGPAYEDKVARRAIRVCDLAEPDDARRQARRTAAAPQHAARRASARRRSRRRRCWTALLELAPRDPALRRAGLGAAGRGAARRASASCSRARRR